MMHIDRRSLLTGVFAGALASALAFGVFTWFRSAPRGSAPSQAGTPLHGQEQPGGPVESPPGLASQASGATPATVELSPEEQRAAGVQTIEVRRRDLAGTLMLAGRVEEAETSLSTISARVGGRIDKLYLDFTGQSVHKGQPIALIYSPEVVSAAEEYRLALESLERLGSSALPDAQAQARELVTASRRRLELWGLTAPQIREIEKSNEPGIHITIYAPAGGTVMERKVTEGQYVREGDPLYSITDLSTVWVKADVYESDLPMVRLGQAVEITAEALPGTPLSGRVSFIEPTLNPQTRTVPVRIQVLNPSLRLRPGMYARAMLQHSLGRNLLAVPRTAVIDTGMKTLVYVAKGNGVFEGREVKLGPGGEEFRPVLTGLNEGERIVTQGSFLIDSQTRLSGGVTGLFGGSKQFAPEGSGAQTGESGQFRITLRTEPSPPKGNSENMFYVSVLDPQGSPVTDAEIRVGSVMPAMPSMGMPETRASAEMKWGGREYAGKANLPTAGPWNVTVEVVRGGRTVATYRTRFTAR